MLSGWSPNALQFVKNLDHHWKPFQRVFTELFLYQLQHVWDPVCYHWYCYYYHAKHIELLSNSFIFHLKSSKGCIVDPRRWKMQNISQRRENSDQILKKTHNFSKGFVERMLHAESNKISPYPWHFFILFNPLISFSQAYSPIRIVLQILQILKELELESIGHEIYRFCFSYLQ